MSKFNIEVISKESFHLGEGPHWCPKTDKLYFVDILGNLAGRLDTDKQEYEVLVRCDSTVSSVFPIENDLNSVIISTNKDVFKVNIVNGQKTRIDGIENDQVRFNDAKCDSKGRLWIGTMGLETSPGVVTPDAGSLYKLSDNGKLEVMLKNVSLSNGLCWSHDDKTMFYIDSAKRLIYSFDFDSSNGTIDNQRILTDMNAGDWFKKDELPDGMTIDVAGNLWVAMFNGDRIVCIDSQTGQPLDEIAMPTSMITSVCFGGKQMNQLFVTSCKKVLPAEKQLRQPNAGKIFRITNPTNPKFCGLKANYNFREL